MEKKIYFEPKVDVYKINIKTHLLGESDTEVGKGDENEGLGSKGANINWEGEDE